MIYGSAGNFLGILYEVNKIPSSKGVCKYLAKFWPG